MIVISTYNPQSQRTTEDEELLTTLLNAIVAWRVRCDRLRSDAITETGKEYTERQIKNSDTIIQLVAPLLGLTFSEIIEIIRNEAKR